MEKCWLLLVTNFSKEVHCIICVLWSDTKLLLARKDLCLSPLNRKSNPVFNLTATRNIMATSMVLARSEACILYISFLVGKFVILTHSNAFNLTLCSQKVILVSQKPIYQAQWESCLDILFLFRESCSWHLLIVGWGTQGGREDVVEIVWVPLIYLKVKWHLAGWFWYLSSL